MRWLRRTLAVLCACAGLFTVTVAPAHATVGDLSGSRFCKTYYHLNDPATGWGFTQCIKIQFDDTGEVRYWRATGSVSSTTPGLWIFNHEVRLDVTVADLGQPGPLPIQSWYGHTPPGEGFVTGNTPWITCAPGVSMLRMRARIYGNVSWPNGTHSSYEDTWTFSNNPNYWANLLLCQ